MASSGSATSSGGNMVKNIAVGVITTVLGATAVYFLGFHDSGKDDKKKMKEATVTAWNSLLQYENLFQQTSGKMTCMDNTEDASKAITDEMSQLISDMGNIKKVQNIDNRMETLVDRRISSYTKRLSYINDFYKEALPLEKMENQQEAGKLVVPIQKKLADRTVQLDENDKDFIFDIISTLEKEYDVTFNIPAYNLPVTKENITGRWKWNKAADVSINADRSFSWAGGNESYTGTWELNNETLLFIFSDGEKLSYTVKGVDPRMIRMMNMSDSSFALGCRQ